jgi:chromosome segregation ATPase
MTENFLEKDLRSKCLGILIEQTSSSRNAPASSADSGFRNTDEIAQIIGKSTTIAEVDGQRRAIARTEDSIQETRKRLREASLNLQVLYDNRDSEIANAVAGIAEEEAKKSAVEKIQERYWNRIYRLEDDIKEIENQLDKFKEYLEIGHRTLTTLETEYEKSRKLLRIHGFTDSENPAAKAPLAVVNLERQITAEACAGILGVRNNASRENDGKEIAITTLPGVTQ